jgi:parvulin-like peptidyl-prolyl isomerase
MCALSLATALTARAETANRIVAIVNDEVITELDVRADMNVLLQRQDVAPADEAEAEELQQAVLQRLIEERLIIQEAKRLALSVGAEDVMQRLRMIQERLGSPKAYEQMLQDAGLNEEQLKQKLREQLLAQQAIDQEVRSKVWVSPTEIAKASSSSAAAVNPGTEALASHLLIRVTAQRSAEQALALAAKLREQLVGGADFAELARRHSEDPHAEAGGSLGWVRQGHMLPELDEALFRLNPGEVSAPIQTSLGFHLLKVIERRSLSERDAAEAQRRLEQRLFQEKFAEALHRWLGELKQRAYIQIVDE